MRYSNWQNKATAIWLVVVACVAIAMAVLWVKKEIHIQSNIVQLLPAISQNADILASHQQVSQRLNQQVFVMLQAEQAEQLEHATEQFLQQSEQLQLWQAIVPQQSEQFAQTLYQHRAGLLSQEQRQLLQQQNYDAFLEKSMLQLLSPTLPISEQLLRDDPLLLFPQYVMQQSQTVNANISMEQGFATLHQAQDDGSTLHARLIVLQLLKSPYDIDYQQKTTAWFEQLKSQFSAQNIQLLWTGTLAFASAGTQSAKQEISTIGLGSSLGVVLLVLFGFRSLRPLITEFVAVSVGSLLAFAVTHTLFGEVHLMTLVFGASLIGASVDFSFYFMAMQSQQRDKNGFAILTPLLPSLFLGLMTTIIGYLFLSITPFPAFKQIAVFSAVGLASAWLTSILLLPRLSPLNAQSALKTLAFLPQLRQFFMQKSQRRVLMIAVAVVVSAMGLAQIQFNDDIRNLQSVNPQLTADDQRIRQLFSQQGGSEYFILQAKNAEQLDQLEWQLVQQLSTLQQQGKIQHIQAIAQWINPLQQAQDIAQLQRIPQQKLREYAQTMGLNFADVQRWQQHLAEQSRLTLAQFQQHPFAQFALNDTQRIVVVQGIQDYAAMEALQNSHVHFMQPTRSLSQQFALHRVHAQWLLAGALLSIALLLAVLYGRKSVFALMLPVSLALSVTFALQGLLGIELNLFSIMGCFLILGIGVDYAIFYRHGHQQDHVVAMALFLCMMSTLLGFGLLALSNTYAIFCFGLTVLCGVILSYIFSSCLTPADSDYQVNQRLKTEQNYAKD